MNTEYISINKSLSLLRCYAKIIFISTINIKFYNKYFIILQLI